MILKINPELEKLFNKLSDEDNEALYESLKEKGQLEKIDVMADGETIIDGHHRYNLLVGLKKEPAILVHPEIKTIEEALLYADEKNNARRHQTLIEKIEEKLKILDLQRKMARERMLSGKDPREIFPEGTGRAAEIVARKIGISYKTLEKAERVLRSGKEKLIAQLRNGELSIDAAHRILNKKPETTKIPKERELGSVICNCGRRHRVIRLADGSLTLRDSYE